MNPMWGGMEQFQHFYWPWPIAVYLFLAGLSTGALMTSLIVKNRQPDDAKNGIIIKAGAAVAPIAVMVGLLLLVIDLGKPFTFYLLILHFNPISVMSLGVILLSFYTPLALLYSITVFNDEINKFEFLKSLRWISNYMKNHYKLRIILRAILFGMAILVSVYTGFLLSAVSKIPLWTNAVLPVLFLASAMSAGIATNILVAQIFLKKEDNQDICNILYVLGIDVKIIIGEILLLATLFISMFFGDAVSMNGAIMALKTGEYIWLFWIGVVLIGLIAPMLIDIFVFHKFGHKPLFITINSILVIVGVFLLRYYIVYAGQAMIHL